MTIKDELIKKGKYNDVMQIVDYIDSSVHGLLPVRWHLNREGDLVTHVKAEGVRKGITIWSYIIELDQRQIKYTDMLGAFRIYVEDLVDQHLHNYANDLVRKTKPDESLEQIRALSVLLDTLWFILCNEEDDYTPFEINY